MSYKPHTNPVRSELLENSLVLDGVSTNEPSQASLVAQLVKNLPAMQETPVQFLGQEDPLEEGMATHSSILAWKLPMDKRAWWATVHGVAKSQT